MSREMFRKTLEILSENEFIQKTSFKLYQNMDETQRIPRQVQNKFRNVIRGFGRQCIPSQSKFVQFWQHRWDRFIR